MAALHRGVNHLLKPWRKHWSPPHIPKILENPQNLPKNTTLTIKYKNSPFRIPPPKPPSSGTRRLTAPTTCILTLDGEVLPLDGVVGKGQAAIILGWAESQQARGGEDFRHLQEGDGTKWCLEGCLWVLYRVLGFVKVVNCIIFTLEKSSIVKKNGKSRENGTFNSKKVVLY